jgi:hypothetical protein
MHGTLLNLNGLEHRLQRRDPDEAGCGYVSSAQS